jgi:hypothetical protein
MPPTAQSDEPIEDAVEGSVCTALVGVVESIILAELADEKTLLHSSLAPVSLKSERPSLRPTYLVLNRVSFS